MWVIRLTDKQLEVLRALLALRGASRAGAARALEAIELARWDELPDAQLPWDEVSELAAEQGISEADVVWDLAGPVSDLASTRRSRNRSCGRACRRRSSR